MIHHHSASEEIQSYLQTLYTTGVIKNLIEAVIEFNKDQTDAIDKLVTTEQVELEMAVVEEENTSASAASAFSSASASSASSAASSTSASSASTVPDTISSSDTATSQPLPQTPQQRGGFFKLLRCFFSGCCG
jgi:predicted O-linked N-acetylglucosamine transferase (SPINDLY family)